VFYDLSHAIENDMTVYPGDPEPRIGRAEQDPPWTVSTLYLGTHTGTHMDAARHYYPDATTIDAYPVAHFIVPATVVDVRGLGDDEPIHVGDDHSRRRARAGWRRRPAGDRLGQALSRRTLPHASVSDCRGGPRPGRDRRGGGGHRRDEPRLVGPGTADAHQILLGHDVLLVENLTGLEQLEPGRLYHCAFVPLRLAGLDGSPIRAIAWDE
jgi:arylformamidase